MTPLSDEEPYLCGNCDSPLPSPSAHAACGHGYMTGCEECGIAYEGGYSLARDPESGPPCQLLVREMEESIRAGNSDYEEEYGEIRARWSSIREFTLPA